MQCTGQKLAVTVAGSQPEALQVKGNAGFPAKVSGFKRSALGLDVSGGRPHCTALRGRDQDSLLQNRPRKLTQWLDE